MEHILLTQMELPFSSYINVTVYVRFHMKPMSDI
jgi:hypothetical protein